MLSSNSTISPINQGGETINTNSAIDDNSALTNDDLSSAAEDSAETATKNSHYSADTAPKVTEEPLDTTNKISDLSLETTTKIQDQNETQTFGDNPGHLPDDAIKSDDKNPNAIRNDIDPHNNEQSSIAEAQISEESTLTQKQASETMEATSSTLKPEEIHEEENPKAQDENLDPKRKENREPENVNVGETQQQSIPERPEDDVQSFDAQEPKKYEAEQNKQFREDKGEIVEKDQKQQPQEIHEEKQEQQPKTDENPDPTTETSEKEPQVPLRDQSSELSQEDTKKKKKKKTHKVQDESHETEGFQEPKPEKKKKKHKAGHKDDTNSLPKDSKKSWSTQADQSKKEKEVQVPTWQLCNVTAGTDYIPCLDNEAVISKLHSRKHFEHRERHCPEEAPTCLVPLPKGYKKSIEWPDSRDKVI